MAERGAPEGNTNAKRGSQFRQAIQWALDHFDDQEHPLGKSVRKGMALRAIALRAVEDAIAGDKDARKEIADRLDGKPLQTIGGTGENGELTVIVKGSDANVL